jgi:hypothetical protein
MPHAPAFVQHGEYADPGPGLEHCDWLLHGPHRSPPPSGLPASDGQEHAPAMQTWPETVQSTHALPPFPQAVSSEPTWQPLSESVQPEQWIAPLLLPVGTMGAHPSPQPKKPPSTQSTVGPHGHLYLSPGLQRMSYGVESPADASWLTAESSADVSGLTTELGLCPHADVSTAATPVAAQVKARAPIGEA